jgi:hypothetical protein
MFILSFFISLIRFCFTFPSRYLFTIGRLWVLSLIRWSWQIHAGFPGSGVTRVFTQRSQRFAYGTVTPFGLPFQVILLRIDFVTLWRLLVPSSKSHNPELATPSALTPARFRLFPFRSPQLSESLLFSSPRVTDMFQFTRFPQPALYIQAGVTPHNGCKVFLFGHPWINAW